ncbi:MAG: hypothetical protein ACE5R6_20655 [Candidatus Heimdallarchaeota archaeon]
MEVIGKEGSKGELFPLKKLRDTLGLKNNQKVFYKIRHGKLVVEPIFPPEELLIMRGIFNYTTGGRVSFLL